jgi:hypothetical protein
VNGDDSSIAQLLWAALTTYVTDPPSSLLHDNGASDFSMVLHPSAVAVSV